jgi:rhamnose utilization protein RhaD (predicted bifunctional aldolase and dehydrogenase)
MTAHADPAALAELVAMSRWVGEPDRDLVILAEGNTSLKVGDGMLVKASGASLETATPEDFVELDRGAVERLVVAGTADDEGVREALAAATTWGTRRPSVEALLHVVCQRFAEVRAVIHCHPVPVNSLLCSTRAEELVRGSYFPDQIVSLGDHALLIPYIDPGLPLAHAAVGLLDAHVAEYGAPPKVIYLANHGMFALGSSVAEAQQITSMAVKTARILLGALAVGDPVALSDANRERIHTRPDELFRRAALTAAPLDLPLD